MTNRMYGAFIAFLSAGALMIAATETFARSGVSTRGGFTSTHSMSHPSVAQSLGRYRRKNQGALWPAVGDDFYGYGPADGSTVDATQPTSSDVHYTNTYDVPWDWAHRFPPMVAPSDRPYVPSCPTEAVTVPGRNGTNQTVSVTRCF